MPARRFRNPVSGLSVPHGAPPCSASTFGCWHLEGARAAGRAPGAIPSGPGRTGTAGTAPAAAARRHQSRGRNASPCDCWGVLRRCVPHAPSPGLGRNPAGRGAGRRDSGPVRRRKPLGPCVSLPCSARSWLKQTSYASWDSNFEIKSYLPGADPRRRQPAMVAIQPRLGWIYGTDSDSQKTLAFDRLCLMH